MTGKMSALDDLDEINVERRRGVYRLHFGSAIESAYRSAARKQRRYPRVILFLIFGFSFALAPLYEDALFRVSADLYQMLRIIEYVLVSPLAFATAATTWFEYPGKLTSALQTAAVVSIWSSVLLLRRFALQGAMHYPSSMVGIVVLAVAIFAGFNWYRLAFGASVTLLLASVQEYQMDLHPSDSWLQINAYILMSLIAILGAYVTESAHRLAWLNGRSAALLARTDVLTGLANRVEFNRLFPRIFAQARREQCTVAVALIDIDHFKRINDQHGHLYGDEVLRAMGKTLLQRTARRPLDLNVRFGGEEMVVVWYDVSVETLHLLVDELLGAIRSVSVHAPESGVTLTLTASIGVTWLIPDGASVPEEVLRHADSLMYRAKALGRDQAQIGSYVAGALSRRA